MEVQSIKIDLLLPNEGQIRGLPRNPRLIRNNRFERLKKSLTDDPEMLEFRGLIVYPYGHHYVVVAGNMRRAAAKDLGFTHLPCYVLPEDTTPEKLRAYAIKDNVAFGEDSDDLLSEWDAIELQDFGMNMFVDSDPDAFLPTVKPVPSKAAQDAGALSGRFEVDPDGAARLSGPRALGKFPSQVYLLDNIELMGQFPNDYFDLAVVDPPYGIKVNMNGGLTGPKTHTAKRWDDTIPESLYFSELFRVSKHQIIFGGNYFPLPLTGSWIFWDKAVPEGVSFADGELAWTSYGKSLVKVLIPYSGFVGSDGVRVHPTQKPVKLYDWIFEKYTSVGMKVLDTHLGSGSSRISAHKAGLDFTGCDIDEEYMKLHLKRFETFLADTVGFEESQPN